MDLSSEQQKPEPLEESKVQATQKETDKIMEPLQFETKILKRKTSLTSTMECLMCPKTFLATENGLKNPILAHLLKEHKLVIADVQYVADFPCYITYWKKRFSEECITDICAVIKTNTKESDKAPSENFYLLTEFLPEDRCLRNKLKEDKIADILNKQQAERSDKSFNRKCLFCKQQFKEQRHLLFEHMIADHAFNIGNPDNIVHVNELLDVLAEKLNNLTCIFCAKTFKDWNTLRDHMRKKYHKRIDPKDKSYDKYYLINYLEPGKDWEELQAEDEEEVEKAEEEWSGWNEHIENSFSCLFCDMEYPNVENILIHLKEGHDFDLKAVQKTLRLDFYLQVKVVNYIRKQIQDLKCPCCKEKSTNRELLDVHMDAKQHCCLPEDKSSWDQPEYFFPTLENDGLLLFLEDDDDDDDENGEFDTEIVVPENMP